MKEPRAPKGKPKPRKAGAAGARRDQRDGSARRAGAPTGKASSKAARPRSAQRKPAGSDAASLAPAKQAPAKRAPAKRAQKPAPMPRTAPPRSAPKAARKAAARVDVPRPTEPASASATSPPAQRGRYLSGNAAAARLRQIREVVLRSLDDDKALEVRVIDLNGRSSIADAMVIASGTSTRHVVAMAEHVEQRLRAAKLPVLSLEGAHQGDWVLLDAGDVILHLFRPEVRAFYDLERMWQDAASAGDSGTPVKAKPQGAKPQGAKPQGAKPQGAKPQGAKPRPAKPRHAART